MRHTSIRFIPLAQIKATPKPQPTKRLSPLQEIEALTAQVMRERGLPKHEAQAIVLQRNPYLYARCCAQ